MAEKVKEEEKPLVIPDEALNKPPEGYSQEEWDGLSSGERSGIAEGVGSESDENPPEIEEDVLKQIASEPEKPTEVVEKEPAKPEAKPEEKKEPVGAKPEEPVKPAEEPVKPAEVVVEAPPEGSEPPDEDLLRFRPVISEAELPSIDTIRPDIQAKLDELDQKYDDGDITLKDYNRDRDKINRDITYQNIQAREVAKTQKIWEAEQKHFLINRPRYLDKTLKGNALYGALGEAVKTLEQDPKFSGIRGIELLIAADRAVSETFGLVKSEKPRGSEVKPDKPAGVKPKVEAKPAAPLPDNKTLGDLPNAAPMTVGDAFSYLDNLGGAELEAQLEKMTDAQRDRYLNSR